MAPAVQINLMHYLSSHVTTNQLHGWVEEARKQDEEQMPKKCRQWKKAFNQNMSIPKGRRKTVCLLSKTMAIIETMWSTSTRQSTEQIWPLKSKLRAMKIKYFIWHRIMTQVWHYDVLDLCLRIFLPIEPLWIFWENFYWKYWINAMACCAVNCANRWPRNMGSTPFF